MRSRRLLGILACVLLLSHCTDLGPDHAAKATAPPVLELTRSPPPSQHGKLYGRLIVHSEPPATVSIDGPRTNRHDTPPRDKYDLPPDHYKVQLTRSGYQTWTAKIEITPQSTVTLDVHLQPLFKTILLSPTCPLREIKTVQWEDDDTLFYAVEDCEIDSEEPKDWCCYRYHLDSDTLEKIQVNSQVSETVRAELGLCPLDGEPQPPRALCRQHTLLSESPDGRHMVYGLPALRHDPEGQPACDCYHLWYADLAGYRRDALGEVPAERDNDKPDLIWDREGKWVLIDALDEPRTLYLARPDLLRGIWFRRFPLADQARPYLPGLQPCFSPDGSQIAFVATTWIDGRDSQATWVTDLESRTRQAITVSKQIGLLQWSEDGRYLYILDLARSRALYRVDLESGQEVILYKDLPLPGATQAYAYETGLPSPDMYHWALSPDETKLVYRGANGQEPLLWAIVQFIPQE